MDYILLVIYYLLTMRSFNIVKRVISKIYFEYIQYVYHKVTNYIIERGIQAKYIYNMDEAVYGQNISTKRLISVHVLRNMFLKPAEASFDIVIFSCDSAS